MTSHHRIAAVLAASLIPAFASAYVGCDNAAEMRNRIRARAPAAEAFTAKRFAEVEKYYAKVLADMQAGKITDSDADLQFALFETDKVAHEALHAQWIKAFPKSEAAYLARAYYFQHRGWKSRGSDLARDTSESQFAGMSEWFGRAFDSLDSAERLSRNPLLEWGSRIEMLKAIGRRGDADALYREAITRYPSTVRVRAVYAVARSVRWGGSVAEEERIAEDARGLPEADHRYIVATVQVELGCDCATSDRAQALSYYEHAVAACPAFYDAGSHLIDLYAEKNNLAGIIAAADRLIAQYPADGELYSQRARAYFNSRKMEQGFADYQRAAQFGHARSYMNLGIMYQLGAGTPRDWDKALEMYTTAYEKGIPEGKAEADRLRSLMKRNHS